MNRELAKIMLETAGGLLLNLSSGWFGVILIGPGLTDQDFSGKALTLFNNISFGILSLVISVWIFYKAKNYGYK